MKWTRGLYIATIAMMILFATGIAILTATRLLRHPNAIVALAAPQLAHAQEGAPAVEAPPAEAPSTDEEAPSVEDSSFFMEAIKSIGDIVKLAGTEGVAKITVGLTALLALAQLLILLTKTALFGKIFPSVTGGKKLVIVYIASAVAAFVPLVLAGTPWYIALAAGPVLGAIVNAVHQIYKQATEKA